MARLHDLLFAAIRHFARHGFLHPQEVEQWSNQIEEAADDRLALSRERHRVRQRLEGAFKRAFTRGALMRRHKKIEPWTASRLLPEARAELERRIYASLDLIKLNRAQAVATTLRRFKGWISSIPPGGLPDVAVRPIKRDLSKAALETRFIERRVAIDQTDKLLANIADIVATGSGAIGGIWSAEWLIERKHRKNHAAWDKLWFVQRGSWADEQGLVAHPNGFIGDRFGPNSSPKADDNVVFPARAINCRCELQYIYQLEDVPAEALTAKGRAALARSRTAA